MIAPSIGSLFPASETLNDMVMFSVPSGPVIGVVSISSGSTFIVRPAIDSLREVVRSA